jgi:plastocyanin
MILETMMTFAKYSAAAMIAVAAAFFSQSASAQEAKLEITVKDHKFEPAELHAPAGKPIVITIKNADGKSMEFESKVLHFEKVIAANGSGTVRVKPQQKGSYGFFDDFHEETKGTLIVE